MTTSLPGASDLYGLPPLVGYDKHDLRKQRLPQYSMGVRTALKDNAVGPGAAGYNIENLVRYGVTKANKFTMSSKHYLVDKNKVPGPQAYAVHNSPVFKSQNAPKYSMGKVNTFFYKLCAPGPNKYGINDSFTRYKYPAYSIGVKKYLNELPKSPGPATYPDTNFSKVKISSPKYTITPRNEYTFKLVGPGSNYYNRMEYKPGKRAPSYSFGIRHSPRSGTMIVPCDNIY